MKNYVITQIVQMEYGLGENNVMMETSKVGMVAQIV
jgi:hypothetical protein